VAGNLNFTAFWMIVDLSLFPDRDYAYDSRIGFGELAFLIMIAVKK